MCTILNELKDLVQQIGPCCDSPNCCAPDCCNNGCCNGYPVMTRPFAQVIMTVPPPILAPTRPCPVKPLCVPCPCPPRQITQQEAERQRYDNFYNNYNIDWHNDSACCQIAKRNAPPCPPQLKPGVAVDGKPARCCDYTKKADCCMPGCPTGFKPCKMRLTPPPGCNPNGVWCAQIQPCPPKRRRKASSWYTPGPCCRPCCKHWRPKEPPCLYDCPCKAHCYNHPVGIKPGRCIRCF